MGIFKSITLSDRIALIPILVLALAGCDGPVRVYSVVDVQTSGEAPETIARLTVELNRSGIIEEIGYYPVRSESGTITTISANLNGIELRPYLIGNFYSGSDTVFLLIWNRSEEDSQIPFSSIVLATDGDGSQETQHPTKNTLTTLPEIVEIERCAIEDWEELVANAGSVRNHRDVEGGIQSLRRLRGNLDALFHDKETYSNRISSTYSKESVRESFIVRKGECIRMVASFQEGALKTSDGLLRLRIEETDVDSGYVVNFVLKQTMSAKRYYY